ncbi:MAG TPA: FHA domain-containing protein [Vicinamibacteria bacterium]|nr:FHA domain-containing protein [Vicinamibacteria bacterium]
MGILRLIPSSGVPVEIKGDAATVVGREPGCDVVISDGSVSRKHARIEKKGVGFTVTDQGSANGTFVDSQRVAEAALKTGQEVRFGAITFRVEIEGDDELSATVVAAPPSGPDATVMTPLDMAMTPALGIPTVPKVPVRPAAPAAPPPPLPKAGPPPLARPAAPSVPSPRASSPPPTTAPTAPRASAQSAAPVGQMAPPSTSAKKGKGPVFWVFLGCCGCLLVGIMLVAGIAGAAFWSTRAPATVVQAQLVELKRGDLEAAYHRLSADLQSQLSREDFERLVHEHAGLADNKDATFWKRSVVNDRATLSGVLTAGSGQVEAATFELVKEGSEWRVTSIRVGETPGE